MPHVFDVSIAGPFYPMDSLVHHIKRRCEREGSLPGVSMLHKTVAAFGIVSLGHLVAPLPNGHQMQIEIVRERNAEVAAFLRGCPPGSPRPVYLILKQTCHPDHEQILASGWPYEYVPTLEFHVLQTCFGKDEANEQAREILDKMKTKAAPGNGIVGGLVDGHFVGHLSGSDGVKKELLVVHFDDGKVDRDGALGY